MTRPDASVEELAWATCADPDDIRYYLSTFVDLHDDVVPYDLITDIHQAFNPGCARSVPAYHGQGGDDI